MIEERVEIINRLGLHARAAGKLVDCASRFSSRIQIGKSEQLVDAKSIMSVMMLAAAKGTELAIEIEGRDEQDAWEALSNLINNRFDEPE